MGIRAEKKKVLQQIVNKEDSNLDIDPESLLGTGDLHWFEITQKRPDTSQEKDVPEDSKADAHD